MSLYSATIVATASYLPEKIVKNEDFPASLETSDEWIFSRTGIKERRIAENMSTSDMAFEVGRKLIKKSGLQPNDIDMIIVATTTPDLTFPSTAALVQDKLSITNNSAAFDVQAVCSGFIYGLTLANDRIRLGEAENVLVIGAERMSKILNWEDRSSCVLFGDGAGGVLLQRREENFPNRILKTQIKSCGSLNKILTTDGGIGSNGVTGKIVMNGREVFKIAVEKFSETIVGLASEIKVDLSEIDLIVPHQANVRIIEKIAEKLSIDRGKFVVTLEKHANSSAASIGLALDDYLKNQEKSGISQKGKLVLMCAVGGGMTWGGAILRL